MSEEFEARAGAPQQPPQEGAEEQEKLPQEELFYWLQTLVTAIVCIVLVFTFLGRCGPWAMSRSRGTSWC